MTLDEVIEIRRLYATGLYSQSELARQFNTAQSRIHLIVHRKIWKEVHRCAP
jgi:hypothetical protein